MSVHPPRCFSCGKQLNHLYQEYIKIKNNTQLQTEEENYTVNLSNGSNISLEHNQPIIDFFNKNGITNDCCLRMFNFPTIDTIFLKHEDRSKTEVNDLLINL